MSKDGMDMSRDMAHPRFYTLALQLAAVVGLIRVFKIEDAQGFTALAPLIFIGFLVHQALDTRFKLTFFVLLSMAAAVVVLGLEYGLALIGLALSLIALCHLPVPFAWRVLLLLAAGGVLAAMRMEWIWTPGFASVVVVPIVAAMFMFRIILYMMQQRRGDEASLSQRLAYFFLLPNVCFLLFPVVDYGTFKRTYYAAPSHQIYQKGIDWMLRGVVHILLYRIIYHLLLPVPGEVEGVWGLTGYIVATYALYLRISGQFHLIIGILCLFGFNLPETHHRYFLATGFNDYWRRINIYWKDFMTKVVYYPVIMKLRGLGMTGALVVATLAVFTATWLLHSYQWFWLRGSFPVLATDIAFWGILGALVVVNSLRQARKRSAARASMNKFLDILKSSMKIVAMFIVVSFLWSMWSSPSMTAWFELLGRGRNGGLADWALLVSGIMALVLALTGVRWLSSRATPRLEAAHRGHTGRRAVTTVLSSAGLLVLTIPAIQGRLHPSLSSVVAAVESENLSKADLARMDRGYYEGLLEAPRLTDALWIVRGRRPADWVGTRDADFVREREDLLEFDLAPDVRVSYKGAPFATNSWGMRDDEYPLDKAPQSFRIALLGASYTMGAGVVKDSTLEGRLERLLNAGDIHEPYGRVEVLNFAVGGYSVVQNGALIRNRVMIFNPDLVIYTVHSTEANRMAGHITKVLEKRGSLGVPELDGILEQSGIRSEMDSEEIRSLVANQGHNALLTWGFRRIAQAAAEKGVPALAAFVPTTEEEPSEAAAAAAHVLEIAASTGLLPLDLHNSFAGWQRREIQLAPWDRHPSALGHAILADALFEGLRENAVTLGLPFGTPMREVAIDDVSGGQAPRGSPRRPQGG